MRTIREEFLRLSDAQYNNIRVQYSTRAVYCPLVYTTVYSIYQQCLIYHREHSTAQHRTAQQWDLKRRMQSQRAMLRCRISEAENRQRMPVTRKAQINLCILSFELEVKTHCNRCACATSLHFTRIRKHLHYECMLLYILFYSAVHSVDLRV